MAKVQKGFNIVLATSVSGELTICLTGGVGSTDSPTWSGETKSCAATGFTEEQLASASAFFDAGELEWQTIYL